MLSTADVVVIGGGITGSSTAFQLAHRGLKVALVEKRFIAAGSTGKSSAIIRQHYSNETTARMALYSLRVFANFKDAVGGDAGFVRTGFAVIVEAKDRLGLTENVEMHRRLGIDTRILSPRDLQDLDPGIAGAAEVVVAYEPASGYADPAFTTTSYVEAAKRHGAQVYQGVRVTGIELRESRVSAVQTTDGTISTPAVVNCCNAWAAQVGEMVGVALPIQASRHQVATFQSPTAQNRARFAAGDFVNQIYYRPEGSALTLVGSIEAAEAEHKTDPDLYNESVDYDFVEDAAQRIRNRYPHMEHAFSRGGWSGIYGVTPDWHPIIDEVPAKSGFFVAAGFSGHGFKLGPAVGVMVADLVTGARSPTPVDSTGAGLDASLFRYERFSENKLVRGKYEYSIVG